MKIFRINGKEYTAKAFDFNMICDLEDMGVSLEDAKNKPMSMARAYFAICSGRGKVFAGEEMEKHIVNGGSFEEVLNVMGDEMEKSDFFLSLKQAAKQEVIENPA